MPISKVVAYSSKLGMAICGAPYLFQVPGMSLVVVGIGCYSNLREMD
jgi:hypothetical protein